MAKACLKIPYPNNWNTIELRAVVTTAKQFANKSRPELELSVKKLSAASINYYRYFLIGVRLRAGVDSERGAKDVVNRHSSQERINVE